MKIRESIVKRLEKRAKSKIVEWSEPNYKWMGGTTFYKIYCKDENGKEWLYQEITQDKRNYFICEFNWKENQ